MFFGNYSPSLVGQRPDLISIDGGYLQNDTKDLDVNGESVSHSTILLPIEVKLTFEFQNLDLSYAMALADPQTVTLYQVGDNEEGASFNNFLDALDGTFCTADGGDDPTQDSVYPDTQPGGYNGSEACGGTAAAYVISSSYGYNEADLTPFYEMRQCNEYMKLGLQGATFLYSSGDNGVAGNAAECINTTTKSYNSGIYPRSCLW
jgi:tripeptidyl-peptidase-1